MTFASLLVANRGEIAIRIIRAAQDLGLHTVAVYTGDDAESLHTRVADEAYELPGKGARGYLDIAAMIDAARAIAMPPRMGPPFRLRSTASNW